MRTTRYPLYAAGLMVIAAVAVTGCKTDSGTGAASPGGAPSAAGSAADVVKLAAKTASGANSFTGTMNVRVTAKPGAPAGGFGLSAAFAERVHPSLLASVTAGSLSSSGAPLPSGLSEVVTPATLYLKWGFLTQTLHLAKPWLAVPVASISQGSGIDFSQVFGQATGSGPLTQSQLLAGATSVRQAGTGSIGGVPVTEYTGTLPLDEAVAHLSGSAKSQVQRAIAQAGFSTATFTAWIDGQHTVRKLVVTESGKAVTETTTTTITSINQPVSISVPAAGETSSLPSGALGGLH